MALAVQMDLLLVHEMTVVWNNNVTSDSSRARTLYPCEFHTFFDTTPTKLLDAEIYSQIAIPLKEAPYRNAALLTLLLLTIPHRFPSLQWRTAAVPHTTLSHSPVVPTTMPVPLLSLCQSVQCEPVQPSLQFRQSLMDPEVISRLQQP